MSFEEAQAEVTAHQLTRIADALEKANRLKKKEIGIQVLTTGLPKKSMEDMIDHIDEL
jgi:hypothetical protein